MSGRTLLGSFGSTLLGRTTTRLASTQSTTPSRLATTVTPESRATMCSMPVPISGLVVRISGTAWGCMFDPMSARLASSCSRNGISDAATLTSWFGDTSMRVTSSGRDITTSEPLRLDTKSLASLPFFCSALAWVMIWPSSWSAEKNFTSSLILPPSTARYGVSMKPYSLIWANVDSDAMRPMFGPSGVSIGQMRP